MEAHRLLQTNFLALRFLTNFGLVVDGHQHENKRALIVLLVSLTCSTKTEDLK